MRVLRIVSVLGAALFAYLALIPGGLVVASLDPACSGPECGYSALGDVALVVVYAVAFVSLLVTAASFVGLAISPESDRAAGLTIRSLGVTALSVGAAMFAIFAIGSPIAAAVIAVIGVACFVGLSRRRDRLDAGASDADGAASHAGTNGHGPKLDRLPRV